MDPNLQKTPQKGSLRGSCQEEDQKGPKVATCYRWCQFGSHQAKESRKARTTCCIERSRFKVRRYIQYQKLINAFREVKDRKKAKAAATTKKASTTAKTTTAPKQTKSAKQAPAKKGTGQKR
jgi:hypothetical protein